MLRQIKIKGSFSCPKIFAEEYKRFFYAVIMGFSIDTFTMKSSTAFFQDMKNCSVFFFQR